MKTAWTPECETPSRVDLPRTLRCVGFRVEGLGPQLLIHLATVGLRVVQGPGKLDWGFAAC